MTNKKIISAIVMIALAVSIAAVMAEQNVNAATTRPSGPTAQERCTYNLQQHVAAGGSQGSYVSSITRSTCGGSID